MNKISGDYRLLKEYINKTSYPPSWLLQLQINIFEKYIKDMGSSKIKRYIFMKFNYKIKYKVISLVQFQKSIDKGLDKGLKQQPFRQKRNPSWGKNLPSGRKGKKVEAYSKS